MHIHICLSVIKCLVKVKLIFVDLKGLKNPSLLKTRLRTPQLLNAKKGHLKGNEPYGTLWNPFKPL